jgi:hypothetical protein|eukprot:SAG25_NODE_790_length_5301_cov_2.342176_2_plen_62_part_00
MVTVWQHSVEVGRQPEESGEPAEHGQGRVRESSVARSSRRGSVRRRRKSLVDTAMPLLDNR